MPGLIPLTIVLGTVLGFTLLGWRLAHAQFTPTPNGGKRTSGARSRNGNNYLWPSWAVSGIDAHAIDELRILLQHGEREALTAFWAYYRPSLAALDLYLAQLRDRYFTALGKPLDAATPQERKAALQSVSLDDAPGGLGFLALRAADLQALLENDISTPRTITRDLLKKFGGRQLFIKNFRTYVTRQREGSVSLFVPPGDSDRALFEHLEKAGLAARGRAIPLAERLTALNTDELHQLAVELGIAQTFLRRRDYAEALSAVPGAAVKLSMRYSVDDLYFLVPIGIDPSAVEREWHLLSLYTDFLFQLQDLHREPLPHLAEA